MNIKTSNVNIAEKLHYSVDDIKGLYGLDQWTIRMWVDRFEFEHLTMADNRILFTQQAVYQIGVICRLMKKKMKLEDVRRYLESEFGNHGE
ncbi:MAG: helix-turn-helix domain-containing protein [Bacteroidales bacterium]|jgi:DNA-binding transcriptional MerR regulator|nr:helix-turn-helix domain-containing protein [Bacteroidales bacterium]